MISKLSSFTLSALMVMTFSDVEYTNVLAAPEDDKDPFAQKEDTDTEEPPPLGFEGGDSTDKGGAAGGNGGVSTDGGADKGENTDTGPVPGGSGPVPGGSFGGNAAADKDGFNADFGGSVNDKEGGNADFGGEAAADKEGGFNADFGAGAESDIFDQLANLPGEDDKGGLKDEFGDEYGSLDAEDPYGPPDENDGYDIDEFLSQKEEEEDTDAPEEKIDRPPKAADVDPLAKQTFSNKLSCNICVRAGYTYMYQNLVGATQYYRQIDRFSQYDGYCCKKELDGTYNCGELSTVNAVGTTIKTKITLEGKPNSNDFVTKELALAACPTKESICGKKQHYLWGVGAKAEEVTVSISTNAAQNLVKVNKGEDAGFTQKDECHWLIQTRCGVPTIRIVPDYIYEFDAAGEQIKPDPNKKLPKFLVSDQYLRMSYMEWQPELNPNMDLNGMFPGPKSKPIDVGPAYVQFPGEFPDFKQKVFDSTKKYTGFKRLFPAYLVTENIKTFMKKVDTYNDLKREYDNLREEYNEAVKNYQSIKKIYEVAKDVWYGEEALRIEEEGPEVADARRGEPQAPDGRPAPVSENFRTEAYNLYVQAWGLTTDAFLAMPEKPKIPAKPPVYEGFKFDDFELFQGYGYFTGGILSLNTWSYGQIKSFGTLGQSNPPLNKKFWRYSAAEKKEYEDEQEDYLEELKKEAELYNLTLNGTKLIPKNNTKNSTSTTKTDTAKTTTQRWMDQFVQQQMDLFNLLSQDTTTTTTTPAATTTTSNSTTNATSNSTKNSTSNSTKNSTANATKPKPPPPRLFKFDDLPPRRPPKNQSGILNGYALGEECTPRFVLLSLMPNTILSNQWPFAADTQGVKIIMSSEYMDQSRPLEPPEEIEPMLPSSRTKVLRPGVTPAEAAALEAGEDSAMGALSASAAAALGLAALTLF